MDSLYSNIYTREIDRLKSELEQAHTLLRKAQWLVHCGQYHQWNTMENCTEKDCKAVVKTLRSLAITELE
jgi:hypothetical protein